MAGAEASLDEVAPGVWRIHLGQPEAQTPLRFREHAVRTAELAALPPCRDLPFPAAGVQFKAVARGSAIELPLADGEQIYGLGMNLKTFRLLGSKRTVRISDDQTGVLGDSHGAAPFYVSTRGYGVYVDTARYASFYFGNLYPALDPSVASQPASGGRLEPGEDRLHRPQALGPKLVGIDVPGARGVDVYVFAGPDMCHAVQRYNLFSGGGCLPPMWGLGVWYRASTELDQKAVMSFLQEFRQRHIPCDVFGLEPGWQSHAYPCSFVWSRRYPDPDGLCVETGPAGLQAEPLGTLLHASQVAALQAAVPLERPLQSVRRPRARFRHARSPQNFRRSPRSHALRQGSQRLQARRVRPSADQDRPLVVARAGGLSLRPGRRADAPADRPPLSATRWKPSSAGITSGRWDWCGPAAPWPPRCPLPSTATPTTTATMSAPSPPPGFAGQLWCPEVRDMASLDEFYRRLETCIFNRGHPGRLLVLEKPGVEADQHRSEQQRQVHGPLGADRGGLPETFAIADGVVALSHAAYGEYRYAGVPPTRALVMDYPQDAAAGAVEDQYMFGPSLMVAPLFAGQTRRSVYLPKGDWYDFWTGRNTPAAAASTSRSRRADSGLRQIWDPAAAGRAGRVRRRRRPNSP